MLRMNSDPFLRHCCITFFIFQDIFQTVFRFLDLKSGLAFWLYVDHEITVLLVSPAGFCNPFKHFSRHYFGWCLEQL